MRVMFCSSEVFPFSKTGGLADMAAFLPKAMHKMGHEIKIITPYYPSVAKYHQQMKYLGEANIIMGGIETKVHYFELIHDGISIIFVQNMHYFERPMLYGYGDDAERFACFSFAVLESLRIIDFYPELLHLNDWQTGIVPYLLDKHYRHLNNRYFTIHTLLTIHNLQYQGVFDPYVSRFFNHEFDYTTVHFGSINFLKTGIEKATKINTVSPTYRNEILTQEYGFTLDGALSKRQSDLSGVLNGIDEHVFNSKTDPTLYRNYGLRDVTIGKAVNKEAVLRDFDLPVDLKRPLVSYIGRLATQKGIELMIPILEEVIEHSNAYFILMGTGQPEYEEFFYHLKLKFPMRVAVFTSFDEKKAHQLYAASDLFMMPSRFEPCGLGQMIAMKYGALPIVRETGGLIDTVIPYNKFTGEGTGFTFSNYDAYDLKEGLFAAIKLFDEDQSAWKKLVKQAMKQDFGLKKMALEYHELYQTIGGKK